LHHGKGKGKAGGERGLGGKAKSPGEKRKRASTTNGGGGKPNGTTGGEGVELCQMKEGPRGSTVNNKKERKYERSGEGKDTKEGQEITILEESKNKTQGEGEKKSRSS